MQLQRFLRTRLPVMAAHTIELIILVSMLHWTQHLLSTPTPFLYQTYAGEASSVQVQAADYQREVWAIAAGLSGLLWILAKSLLMFTVKASLSQPLSMADLKRLLLALLLALAALAALAVGHHMTT